MFFFKRYLIRWYWNQKLFVDVVGIPIAQMVMESLISTIKLMFHIQEENGRNWGILFFVCFKFEFHLFHTLYAFLAETSQPIQLIVLNPANHNRQYGFGYSLRDTDVKNNQYEVPCYR